jgi:hypothetical protein
MSVTSYEERLSSNSRWALSEGSKFFEDRSEVQDALRRITKRLTELNVPYVVVDGMALFHHGYRRFTEDVDIVVTRESLTRIHEALDGLGYVREFRGSRNLRDSESGVKIEFLITGEYPGDGKPKPIAFPDPDDMVTLEADGMRFVTLPMLVNLKIASGMTNPGRLHDLADVQELIKRVPLTRDFAEKLDPYAKDKYLELWDGVQQGAATEME